MKKSYITIMINKDVTKDEIKQIRDAFKNDPANEHYILNIVVSGHDNFKDNLYNFIKFGIK